MDINMVLEMDYETQHFGFHPRGFVDGVYNTVLDYLRDSLDSLQKFLVQKFSNKISKEDSQNKAQAMMQVLTQKLDKAADRLEVFLNRNVFAIPSHVVLPEDEIHMTNPITKEQMDLLDKGIIEKELQIIKAKHKNALLKEKLRQQNVVKERQLELINRHKQQTLIASEAGIPDLHRSLLYYSSKAKELCEITSSRANEWSTASISRLT